MTDLSSTHAIPFGPEAPGNATLRMAQDFVSRRWLVVGATLALVLMATWIALEMIPPRFTAHAEILLDPRREKAFGPDDTLHLISLDASDIDSAIVMIRASALLARVVQAEHLAFDPEFATQRPLGFFAKWFGDRSNRPIGPKETPALQALSALARSLKVERISKAYALAISVTAGRPAGQGGLAG